MSDEVGRGTVRTNYSIMDFSGGLNERDSNTLVAASECVNPSQNITLSRRGAIQKRPGTVATGQAVSGPVTGLYARMGRVIATAGAGKPEFTAHQGEIYTVDGTTGYKKYPESSDTPLEITPYIPLRPDLIDLGENVIPENPKFIINHYQRIWLASPDDEPKRVHFSDLGMPTDDIGDNIEDIRIAHIIQPNYVINPDTRNVIPRSHGEYKIKYYDEDWNLIAIRSRDYYKNPDWDEEEAEEGTLPIDDYEDRFLWGQWEWSFVGDIVVKPEDIPEGYEYDVRTLPPLDWFNDPANNEASFRGRTTDITVGAGYSDWNIDTDYVVGDRVAHKGAVYTCISDHKEVEPGVSEQWDAMWEECTADEGEGVQMWKYTPFRMFRTDYFPANNHIDIPCEHDTEIRSMVLFQDRPHFFTRKSLWTVYGTNPTQYRLVKLRGDVGTVSHRSVVEYNGVLFFLSEEGPVGFDGSRIFRLYRKIPGTMAKINKDLWHNACSIVHNNSLYMALPENENNDVIIEFDLFNDLYNEEAQKSWIPHRGFKPLCWAVTQDNELLFGTQEGQICKYGEGWTDRGVPYESIYTTKAFGGLEDNRFRRMRVLMDNNQGDIILRHRTDFQEWTEDSVSMTTFQPEDAGVTSKVVTTNKKGYMIQLQFRHSEDGPFAVQAADIEFIAKRILDDSNRLEV